VRKSMTQPRRETKGTTRTASDRRAFLVRELKTTNDNAGTFEGYLAVFNNLDGNGDIIERGAFKRTLGLALQTKTSTKSPYLYPLLWQHKEDEPIGGITDAYEDDHGLHITGEYDLDTERGKAAYSGAKKGYLRGLSIGYRTVKSMVDANRDRHLLELQLFEGSPVTFPANDLAMTLTVKNDAAGRAAKTVTGKTTWPLTDRDVAWDNGEATKAIETWADGDADKLASVHFYQAPDSDGTRIGSYKLLFCDVFDGEVKAVWKAVTACTGSHGIEAVSGVSASDLDGIKSKVASYYTKAAKTYADDAIVPPWEAKSLAAKSVAELKQLTGLAALTACAGALDSAADCSAGAAQTLAAACGLSMDDAAAVGKPDAVVSAILAGVPGSEDAVKAVLMSWMEFSQQTDALLSILGLPDTDYPQDVYGYGYMNQLLSAFEMKAGRQLSQSNRSRLAKHMGVLSDQVAEVKSILADNDHPNEDEHNQGADYGDLVASGAHNSPASRGKSRDFSDPTGHGADPDPNGTTPPTANADPSPLDDTLREMDSTLAAFELDKMFAGMSLE
jgi:HK97 family phage prohead protease